MAERPQRQARSTNDWRLMVMADEWARRELSAADQMREALERRGLPADVRPGEGLALVSIWAGLVITCWQHPDGVEFRWPPERLVIEGVPQPYNRRVAGAGDQRAFVEMIADELAVRAQPWALRIWEFLALERIQEEWGEVDRAWLDQAGAEMGLPAMSDGEWAEIASRAWMRPRP